MAIFAWVMMGLALWHFTVWVPDHFWGGIVGAFLASAIGAVLFGLIINGFGLPSRDDITVVTALEAIPGTLIGLGICYWIGLRNERQAAVA